MIVILNGPLGIGKSSLAEALMERIDGCVAVHGDCLISANPPQPDGVEHLHSVIELIVGHHRRLGYRHFVVEHYWESAAALMDLRRRLALIDSDFRCFLLTLPEEENLRRIERRASVRALDELEFERRTFVEERTKLTAAADGELGQHFDVGAPLEDLVATMLDRIGLP